MRIAWMKAWPARLEHMSYLGFYRASRAFALRVDTYMIVVEWGR